MLRKLCALAGVCGGLLAGSAARAEDVSGTVTLPNKKGGQGAVVTLEGEAKAAPVKAVVDQRDKAFSPHVSVVTVGSTVEFPNNDTIFHNVFTYYNGDKFDLGMYPRGTSRKKAFNKKGVIALMCNVHSEMSAYIVVVDTPYYAIAGKGGKFSIKGVPAGTYTLSVWHESGAKLSQPLTVKGDATGLTLTTKR